MEKTQVKLSNIKAVYEGEIRLNFPDNTTTFGKVIDKTVGMDFDYVLAYTEYTPLGGIGRVLLPYHHIDYVTGNVQFSIKVRADETGALIFVYNAMSGQSGLDLLIKYLLVKKILN